jgi:hypothetical protein
MVSVLFLLACWLACAEHSDPDKLREQAETVRRDEAVKDFVERKQRVQEVRS